VKIAVYAICKNEEKFLKRWIASMSEADYICVLDTGSTDATFVRLQLRAKRMDKLIVDQKIISPWRFDEARNESMKLVPDDVDICVCTDLDEIWEPGWRRDLENAWVPGTEQATYKFVWNHNSDGSDGVTLIKEKIHAPHVFKWVKPVHEILARTDGKEHWPTVRMSLPLHHWADDSKSRSSYLPLLELAVEEEPDDDRSAHYLGREYMYKGLWDQAISELKRHLSLPKAVWADERAASMRYIARCYISKGDRAEARRWLLRACAEAPHTREPWWEAEENAYYMADYMGAVWLGKMATSIPERTESYICEPRAWGAEPWDILAVSAWQNGNAELALSAAKKAVEYSPEDARIRNNLNIIAKLAANKT